MKDPIFTMVAVQNAPGSTTKMNSYIDGLCTWFHSDGQICEVANYAMGMMHGENVVYNVDGTIKLYSFYEFGRKVA
ncbi:hypothetical protein BCT74_06920 [Vibrio lentus]|uniref:Uncharacterized protein n=1 Tax=Vibrio lentus TaxID=136468 RepID=A0A2N7IDK9_9VIBR|nr:hypothetical protein BCT74_06920 [Vibrio lentus]